MDRRHYFRHFMAVLLTALSGFGALHATAASPEYRVTIVGPPDSRATAINQHGVVVGYFHANTQSSHAFKSRGSGWIDLAPNSSISDATAINDRGEVLGHVAGPDLALRGVVWHRGVQRDLGTVPGAVVTRYFAINNAGYTVARAYRDNASRSWLRAPNGEYVDLGGLVATDFVTDAHALNNRNQVTGGSVEFSLPEIPFHPFLWRRGVMRDLGDAGDSPNEGNDINNHGQVTGYLSVRTDYPHDRIAFIYTHGRLQDIDGRPRIGQIWSQGQGINNLGHAVGDSNHLFGWVYRGKRMQSLNALIDPAPGWNVRWPIDINDAGQIAATATRNGQDYAVRLDLIRPHLESAPAQDEADAESPLLDPPQSAAQAATEARLDAEAQAREVVHPVQL